ncbi:MAG: helix-turn-helix domain-containing protein [Candidatus Electryonea clarkiae]|nr:helix-turn-helix domain-containing protein [Candidatus Electryonea clarkiae]MDP8288779.1 helix-turn-helix domain-containing protein [Candidatus Electryonea clarkiae]
MAGNRKNNLRNVRKLMRKSTGVENFNPAIALPPADFIYDFLDEKGWNQSTLAEVTSISEKHISQLLNNKAAITDETARKLSLALGADPLFWMKLQFDFERDRAEGKSLYEEIELKRTLHERIPSLTQAIKLKMVNGAQTAENLLEEVLSLTTAKTINDLLEPELHNLRTAALRTHRQPQDRLALAIWANSARRIANDSISNLPEYQPEFLDDFYEEVPGLTLDPDTGPLRAVRLLRNLGVTVMYHPPLKGTTVDGAAFWADKSHPVIALTARKKTLDEFWFVLLHELGHIVSEGYFRDVDLVEEPQASDDPKEQAANNFAADVLIPPDKWEIIRLRAEEQKKRNRTPSGEEFLQFAESVGVHPHIVTGRLHFNNLLPKTHFRKKPYSGRINKRNVIQALFQV